MAPTSLMLRSLVEAPLLVDDLPEATAFPKKRLALPAKVPDLHFKQKLGHLYEDALACLIEASPCFDLVARNLQIQRDRHDTVGELDFLIRDLESGSLIHLELATKFYLVVRDSQEILLPGPDARDDYHKKLHRLRSHQLLLTSRFRKHLPATLHNEPIETRHLIHGCLFDHLNDEHPHSPEFLNPGARRGKWLSVADLPHVLPPGTTLKLIPKFLWPVAPRLLRTSDLEEFAIPAELDRCVMVLSPSGDSPWFITPRGYVPGLGLGEQL